MPVTQARASAFGELDIWLARAGRHEELWAKLGAHPVEGGVRFAVWAPNARQVERRRRLQRLEPPPPISLQPVDETGIWEGIVDGAEPGQHYKYDVDGARESRPGRVRGGGAAEDGIGRATPRRMCGRTRTGSTRDGPGAARPADLDLRAARAVVAHAGSAGASSRPSLRRTCRTSASRMSS